MKRYGYLLFVTVVWISCRKPYNPPAIASAESLIVVEGVINSGSDSTILKISKTVNISSSVLTNPVLGAIVTVESSQGDSYPLTGTANGSYISPGLNLSNSLQYRLRIKTNGEEYLSDFVPVLNSPPIDTISYNIKSDGLDLFSGTHDASNTVKYFRYDYTETWMFQTAYFSQFKSNGDTVLTRDLVNDNIYTCWKSDTSSTIVLGSSAKLSQDVVNNPLTHVSSTSEKIELKYSIMVRQYALTGEAYAFWSSLKKNTEQLGSIFDAQPSQISGNIHNVTNANEPVIGYISVGSVASKRIFINYEILPAWVPQTPYDVCKKTAIPLLYHYVQGVQKQVVNKVDESLNYNTGGPHFDVLIPIAAIPGNPGQPPVGYTAAERSCVDCTLRGTNKQPSFWQ